MCLRSGVQYRVEPREIKARLDSPTVMSVLSMGYPRDIVRQAITKRFTTTGLLRFVVNSLTTYYETEPKGARHGSVALSIVVYSPNST